MSDIGIKRFKPSKFFACGGLRLCFFNKENIRSWNEKVSTFKIFRTMRAHIMCFYGGNVRYWNNKSFNLKICCLWPAHKKFSTFKRFHLRRAHIMYFNKVNLRSWNKMVSTVKIVSRVAGSYYVLQ